MAKCEDYTPKPWAWQDMGGMKLVGQHGLRPIVMDFVRKGMNDATVRFRRDGVMRKFIRTSRHPDASLITAAPDLLEALQDIVEELHKNDMTSCDHEAGICNCYWQELVEQAEEAIAKAKGERILLTYLK